MEQLRIFVSHSSQDKAIADLFVLALRQAGADVWYDEHNLGAGYLKDEIMRELGRRPIFLVLLSKAAFASPWVKRETDWAEELGEDHPSRLLLPVTVGPIERADFSSETGWLFLHRYKRIEAPGYQPYPLAEAIGRTCHMLGLGLMPSATTSPPTLNQSQNQSRPHEGLDEVLPRATALIARQQYAEAIPLLERVTQQDPLRFAAWANLGWAYDETGRPAEGLVAHERALALDSTQSWVWSNKGAALYVLNRPQEALAAYEQALTLDPQNAKAWNNKGVLLRGLKRYEEALTAYEQALSVNPQSANSWTGKGIALYCLKRYEEALAAYEEALVLDPQSANDWTGKAMALRALRRIPEATEAERQASALQ